MTRRRPITAKERDLIAADVEAAVRAISTKYDVSPQTVGVYARAVSRGMVKA